MHARRDDADRVHRAAGGVAPISRIPRRGRPRFRRRVLGSRRHAERVSRGIASERDGRGHAERRTVSSRSESSGRRRLGVRLVLGPPRTSADHRVARGDAPRLRQTSSRRRLGVLRQKRRRGGRPHHRSSAVPWRGRVVTPITALRGVDSRRAFAELETFLEKRRLSVDLVPAIVRDAARQIEAAHGNLAVARLHESFGTSRKHLAVLFRQHVGLSLKAYAKIQRFVWTIGEIRQRTSVSWSQLAGQAGYSDQSHLVRDFRRIGAATPTEYLRQRAPDGSALLYEAGPPGNGVTPRRCCATFLG